MVIRSKFYFPGRFGFFERLKKKYLELESVGLIPLLNVQPPEHVLKLCHGLSD